MSSDEEGLKRRGFLLMSGVPETELMDFAHQLGSIRVDKRSPELVREIRPQPLESAKSNTLSSRYGTNAFPFHTDTAHWHRPARYLILYCVNPGEGDRPTLLQDTHSWRLSVEEEDLICRAMWKTGHLRPHLCTVAEQSEQGLAFRYDRDCMKPMTAEARSVEVVVLAKLEQSPQSRIDWRSRTLLVIDNQRMLHARGQGSRPDYNRVLKRILVGGD
jgi:alpha-ketoglutarate-dependent taurine dioxygenase